MTEIYSLKGESCMNRRMSGVLLSYTLLFVDIVVGVVFVPFLLGGLGEGEYGLYKLMHSTASYLSVLDFGIGATITRYVVKYRTEGRKNEEMNFVAMGLIVYGILAGAVVLLGTGIGVFIPHIYAQSIAPTQMRYAQLLFLMICLNTAVNLFNHAYSGLITAYERFTYSQLANILKVLLRTGLIVVSVSLHPTALIVAGVDLMLSMMMLAVNMFYTRFSMQCRIRLHRWDKGLLKEAFVFTTAVLLQSIINQFNSNVDNIVLGIFTTTSIVAMYSVALQLFTMYSTLSTVVSSVYLPTISRAVFRGADDDQITKAVIGPSRIQLVVLLLALSGFILYGRHFITLWVGAAYIEVYVLATVLMTAATLELSQNTITSVLKAKNILHGKTLILMISTLVNAVITILLVPVWGAMGAAAGTTFSMIFGYGIGLNIYYQKKAGLNMRMYYRETYAGILMAAAVAIVPGLGIGYLVRNDGIFGFILKAGIYVCVYGVVMLFVGLNPGEKQMARRLFQKVLGKINRA